MEPEYCPTCGDIMEPDDVTGEVRCMNEHGGDSVEPEEEKDVFGRTVE